jgi:hypothetical protein
MNFEGHNSGHKYSETTVEIKRMKELLTVGTSKKEV